MCKNKLPKLAFIVEGSLFYYINSASEIAFQTNGKLKICSIVV